MHNSGRDDGFHAPEADESVAESVLTSTLGAYVLPRWGALLRSLSPPNRATQADRAESFGDGLRVALLDQVLHNERGEVVALIRVSKSPPPPPRHHRPGMAGGCAGRGSGLTSNGARVLPRFMQTSHI